ncbi:nucleotidyltransferase family protein [Candidatus Poribacteria bacterium]|nr:nucleotidyltransferase family protein [Candidatus Poribacteria bacterium]
MSHEVSAILLAAGSSKRMGKPKQLLPLGERPVIVHCLETIRGAGIDDIVVVVGSNSDEILQAIEAFTPITVRNRIPESDRFAPTFDFRPSTIRVVQNETPEADMCESVRVGLKKINPASPGIFICLADHPLVKAETFMGMRRCHAERPGAIILPVHKGKRGHPPLLPREILAEIDAVRTLRDLIRRHSKEVHCLDVNDEGVVFDMDTREDYQRILERYSTTPCMREPNNFSYGDITPYGVSE